MRGKVKIFMERCLSVSELYVQKDDMAKDGILDLQKIVHSMFSILNSIKVSDIIKQKN
jgi:hypothetical protein